MIEHLRATLYPLGFVATFLFAARVIVQWLESEKKGKSHASRFFWLLSIAANVIMTTHGLIQLQYPVCIMQAANGVIAWRNLDLMQPKHYPLRIFLLSLIGILALISMLFVLQGVYLESFVWMRKPTLPWNQQAQISVPFAWHLIGCIGMTLFASRFWIQWWCAEHRKISYLGSAFWWISLLGATFSMIYFLKLRDPVHVVSYSFGLIPYVRNLLLLRQ